MTTASLSSCEGKLQQLLQELPCNAVAAEYSECTLTVTLTSSGIVLYETYDVAKVIVIHIANKVNYYENLTIKGSSQFFQFFVQKYINRFLYIHNHSPHIQCEQEYYNKHESEYQRKTRKSSTDKTEDDSPYTFSIKKGIGKWKRGGNQLMRGTLSCMLKKNLNNSIAMPRPYRRLLLLFYPEASEELNNIFIVNYDNPRLSKVTSLIN